MKKHVLKAGFLFISFIMMIAISGCKGSDDSKVTSGRKQGIAVKVKASKF